MCHSAFVALVVALGAGLQGCGGGGGGCTEDQAVEGVENKVGSWAFIQMNPSGQTKITYRFGWEMKGDHGIPEDDWWGATKESLETGFGVWVDGSKLVPVAKAAVPIVMTLLDEFLGSGAEIDDGEDSRYSVTTNFQPGAIWQWDMSLSDQCGNAKMKSKTFMVTTSTGDPPCCLPGMFWDPTKQYQGCRLGGLMCTAGTSLTTQQEKCDEDRSEYVDGGPIKDQFWQGKGYKFILDLASGFCEKEPSCHAAVLSTTEGTGKPHYKYYRVCYPVPAGFRGNIVLIIPNKPLSPHPPEVAVQALV